MQRAHRPQGDALERLDARAVADVYVEWVGDEAVVLNQSTGELHYLNPPAAAVLALLLEHGVERGVHEVVGHFDLAADAQEELAALLEDMAARGIVVSPAAPRPPGHRSEPGEPRAPEG